MSLSGNPGFILLIAWPLIGAVAGYIIGRKSKVLRDYFVNFVVIAAFGGMLALAFLSCNQNPPYFEWRAFMGLRIYFRMDGFRAVYGLIAAFMWLMTTLFSKEYFAHHYRNRNRYYFFLLLTFSATLGVFFSADLITTFLFFEIVSFCSYVLVMHDEKRATIRAAQTYMGVVILSGMALLFGVVNLAHLLQTTEIAALHGAMQSFDGSMTHLYVAAAFMLIGFGAKAGMFPLHIWLPSAHPAAPAPASALLSGVLTKVGVFGVIILGSLIFHRHTGWGMLMLNIGIVGMLAGAVLALFSTDLKRTIAYSSVSQIGFIILGIGMQSFLTNPYYSSMPVQGTLLHMVNHSLIKLLLFLAAGVVVMNVHELDLNKVRGFGRGKPLFAFCFLMGVLAIIGLPLWSGYISKTLLHDSLIYHIWLFKEYSFFTYYFQVAEALFTLAGGLTTAYMIKLFVCLCVEKNEHNQDAMTALNKRYMSKLSGAVLFVCALVLPVLGFAPYLFMIPIGEYGQVFMQGAAPTYALEFFSLLPLRAAFASILIGGIVYLLIVRVYFMKKDGDGRVVYVNLWPAWLDLELLIYRPLFGRALPFAGTLIARVLCGIIPAAASLAYRSFTTFRNHWIAVNENTDIGATVRGSKLAHTVGHENRSRVATLLRPNPESWKPIVGSLAFGLLVFFIGFVIVQIILFL